MMSGVPLRLFVFNCKASVPPLFSRQGIKLSISS